MSDMTTHHDNCNHPACVVRRLFERHPWPWTIHKKNRPWEIGIVPFVFDARDTDFMVITDPMGSQIYALASEYQRLKSENAALKEAQRWIPISERMPQAYLTVLVTYFTAQEPDDQVSIGWFEPDNRWWHLADRATADVTAWRPLPEPYQLETKG